MQCIGVCSPPLPLSISPPPPPSPFSSPKISLGYGYPSSLVFKRGGHDPFPGHRKWFVGTPKNSSFQFVVVLPFEYAKYWEKFFKIMKTLIFFSLSDDFCLICHRLLPIFLFFFLFILTGSLQAELGPHRRRSQEVVHIAEEKLQGGESSLPLQRPRGTKTYYKW